MTDSASSTWTPKPTRGYSWPPFEPGNFAGLRHGATSPRKVTPLAERIAAELAETAPWACRATFAPTIGAWSWAEAQVVLLRQYLDEHGPIDGDGNPRPATALLERIETRAAGLRTELGLSPMALAKLLSALSAAPEGTDDRALERLKDEGRALVDSRTEPVHG